MKYKSKLLLHFGLFQLMVLVSQAQDHKTTWYNPVATDRTVLEGQGWAGAQDGSYSRLPAKAKGAVREAVWNLSQQTAGMMIRFRSNASEIKVRYAVTGSIQMPHMPATGVSGVDLYGISNDGVQLWCAGKYAFKDTITYEYTNLIVGDGYHKLGREYRLYLPLYNGVKWLEIGVADTTKFEALPARPEAPIVVYGTSIAQGACASRPGMAWTNILSRKLDIPVLNLGFSGNGRLEPEVVDLVAEQAAKVFILDCLPNLVVRPNGPVSLQDVRERILASVRTLRQRRPTTPIVLAEHAGYTGAAINAVSKEYYEAVNRVIRQAYSDLSAEGVAQLHLIPIEEFGQDIETMVDGTHPNDLGMMRYAEGYERKLRDILKQPVGTFTTTKPVSQLRELGGYDWELRNKAIMELKNAAVHTVVIGNSITHFWGGQPKAHIARGEKSWNSTFGEKGVINMGFGWDRIENVLWRIYHGALEGVSPQRILVNIGTNNLHLNSDSEIVAGWRLMTEAIQSRQPQAKVYLVGIYPRRKNEERVRVLNSKMEELARQMNVKYVNPGTVFLKGDTIDEALFTDGLHPNETGYSLLGQALKKMIE
ncbi:lysophospholipase L1-like esterase [Dyadobacter jejuensis]|uniref:Lysophospholipase L1-like esterase n=1 Tax=Dyadobacter jejuensis TaxID=1082580 RepID=A0A316AA06_9BACT|nr:SGNH/GDSL hydrolase family protein [Dyadobacter jejuensis]PWJ54493.1 lysophospholipase L1-like esterase [Dyadobacter jejuensis]